MPLGLIAAPGVAGATGAVAVNASALGALEPPALFATIV